MSTPSLRERKQACRRETIARILALNPDRRLHEERALLARVPELPGWRSARVLLLYASAFPEEIVTDPLMVAVLAAGRTLVLPRVERRERRLALHAVRDLDADLVPGPLGLREPRIDSLTVPPEAIDWALVPGIAFDAAGHRLGRGAGHYDRLLPQLRPDCPRWALALGVQVVTGLPIEAHDVPLDGVVRP